MAAIIVQPLTSPRVGMLIASPGWQLCRRCPEAAVNFLTQLSQLRTFFGVFAFIFIVKPCVFIGALPENGRVETKCLPFDHGLLAVCR